MGFFRRKFSVEGPERAKRVEANCFALIQLRGEGRAGASEASGDKICCL
jgi:hypothetical protein